MRGRCSAAAVRRKIPLGELMLADHHARHMIMSWLVDQLYDCYVMVMCPHVIWCMLQWLSCKPNTTVFMGCIGKDRFGEILSEKAEAVGVSVHYQYHEKEATGTAACIITGSSRCVSFDSGSNSENLQSLKATRKILQCGVV